MKRYRIPRKKLSPYWRDFCEIHNDFHRKISQLEVLMSNKLGKKLAFICADGEWCGIGSGDTAMELEQFDPVP